MSRLRDRMIAITAALLVVLLAGSVVTAVLSAERNGRRSLESLQLAQLAQLAHLLDGAIGPALTAPSGLTNPVGAKPWKLTANDAGDTAGLNVLQSRQPPSARTGFVLVDRAGIVVNGSLLVDPAVVGRPYNRPGLSGVLQGRAALLPVEPHSLTTPLPSIVIARPIPDPAGGAAAGAILQESDVAADSTFNQIMAGFHRGRTDEYSFLDSSGVVIASTNAATVGRQADAILLDGKPGFHRHGAIVAAIADIPSAHWRAAYRQSTREFEGNLTGPLRSALLLLIIIALLGAGLTFFVLLARLRAAREEQQRLVRINETREEFISIVSHELRTPATGQLGFLQTLLDHWELLNDAERRRTVGQAYANARRLHALTRDVLDTASIEAGELPYSFEPVDLRSAVGAAVDALPPGDHRVRVGGADGPLAVRADPERIQQVLTNLLDNAVKNSPTGSEIEIRTAATPVGEALVEVSDRGAGMVEDELERAFDKFTRGRHPTTRGTGLGLYISRQIVDAHGGRIWAERRPGGGTTVSFALPLAALDQPTSLDQPGSRDGPGSRDRPASLDRPA
ncbi:MAG: hypothetical protein NVSMB12_11470 [Acidimicrobiales bacterium]